MTPESMGLLGMVLAWAPNLPPKTQALVYRALADLAQFEADGS